jgi:ABC-type multidrug transport system ATPase subunit
VADERSLRWRLSAWENLRLYAVLYGVEPRRVRSRVDEVLDRVGLADTGEKMVGQFSSGMRQRLLIARALLADPRVLLLDEPTRGLDPVSARKLRLFLREEICHRRGCTVLLATHNTEEAFDFCDRVAILDKGRLLVTGPARELVLEYGEERYRLWTDTPEHPALSTLVLRGLAEECTPGPADGAGWTLVDLKIPGGGAAAARLLQFLVAQRVGVWRFEHAGLSLAELIERVQLRVAEERNA